MLLLICHTEINKFNRVQNFNNLKTTTLQELFQNRFQVYLLKEEITSEIRHQQHLFSLKIQNHNNHFKHLLYLLNQCLLNQCLLNQHREINFTIPNQQGQHKVNIDIHLYNKIINFFRRQSFFILILHIILLDLNICLKYFLIIYRFIHIPTKN